MKIKRLSRKAIDSEAWDRCVALSPNRIIYAYTWYLDAVTNLPDRRSLRSTSPVFRWKGFVALNEKGDYAAVMPVPLRRKYGVWVVHQPLFCQFLGVFGANLTPNLVDAFARVLLKHYWYGSIFHLINEPSSPTFRQTPFIMQQEHTHLLNLSSSYETIYGRYTADTRRHLRQAQSARWVTEDSIDTTPLLTLFRQHQARQIPGGVAEWAYSLFEGLFNELQGRGLATLRYAIRQGVIEAGALFVTCDNRIIYLFNAATEVGRREQARTLLIDDVIRERAGSEGYVFDFESPPKQAVIHFYEGFGAIASPFWTLRWNRLPVLLKFRSMFQSAIPLDVHL